LILEFAQLRLDTANARIYRFDLIIVRKITLKKPLAI